MAATHASLTAEFSAYTSHSLGAEWEAEVPANAAEASVGVLPWAVEKRRPPHLLALPGLTKREGAAVAIAVLVLVSACRGRGWQRCVARCRLTRCSRSGRSQT